MKKTTNYFIPLLIVIISLLAFSSCKKEDVEENEPTTTCETSVTKVSEANAILSESTWEWGESRSQGRNGEVVATPQTAGKTMSLIFSLGQTVQELENEQTVGIWEYRINESNDSSQGAFVSSWLNQGNIERSYFLDVCPETLKLVDTSSSLMTTTTYRKK